MASNSSHVLGGHKATLHNPNVSEEAKQHSREILEKELGKESHKDESAAVVEHEHRVAGGLKSAIKNPHVSEEAKESAQKKLDEIEKA